jgi:hypothetical protein
LTGADLELIEVFDGNGDDLQRIDPRRGGRSLAQGHEESVEP